MVDQEYDAKVEDQAVDHVRLLHRRGVRGTGDDRQLGAGETVYGKLQASSRAAATLYATQHGLLGTYERS
jgi:hypothetical protein